MWALQKESQARLVSKAYADVQVQCLDDGVYEEGYYEA